MPTRRLTVLFISLFFMTACSSKKPAKTEKSVPEASPTKPAEIEPKTEKDDAEEAPAEEPEPLTEEDAKSILIGIWRVDVKSLGKKPEVDPLADDEEAAMAVQYRTMAMVAFEFAPDGRFTQFLGQQVLSGKYKIEKANGTVLHIKTTVAGRTSKVTVTVSEENLMLKQGDQPTLRLERGAPKVPGSAP